MMMSSGLGTDSRWFQPRAELALILAFSAVIILGLLGNGMVAVMLCRHGNLRSPRHWYLLNLVVSDILTCVLCMPFTLLRLTLKDWQLGQWLCRVVPFLQLAYVFVSVFTILAIAVERYRAIVCTSRPHHDQQRLAKMVLPGIWLLSLGLATPLAVTHRLEHVHDLSGQHVVLTLCVEHWESDAWLGVYTVVILLFQYALPAAAIMALHLLICRFLRTRVHLRKDSCRSRQKLARHRKNLVLLTVISITFDIEWLPITVVNIIADFDASVFPSAHLFCLTYALCLLFALTSVFVNPVIYGLFNSNFRRDLFGSWGRGGRERRDISESTFRRCSSEVTSRYCTTVVGSSGGSKLGRVEGVLDVSPTHTHNNAGSHSQRSSTDADLNTVLSSGQTKTLRFLDSDGVTTILNGADNRRHSNADCVTNIAMSRHEGGRKGQRMSLH
ncbi:neuropeptide Y receptor type 6-like [Littorina saxatilis]|uniref:neuropeptide Y receptor type 6-like n=1 Tax=Littorina saxatilis TaxID=31220 RepID=UPI0038B5F840